MSVINCHQRGTIEMDPSAPLGQRFLEKHSKALLVLMSVLTSIFVFSAAYLAAWQQYSHQVPGSDPEMSLWEFTATHDQIAIGMKVGCVLAGLLTFPLCRIPSAPRSRRGLVKILALHFVTAMAAIYVAAVMSALHLAPVSGH
jgi:hypothetical protein